MVNSQIGEFEIPMSIQQCYETFCFDSIFLNDYKIFKSLVNYGFIVKRSDTKEIPFVKSIDVHNQEKSKLPTDECESIIQKADYEKMTKNQVFDKLNKFIPNIQLSEIRERLAERKMKKNNSSSQTQKVDVKSNKFRPTYDVYLPNKNFKKSQPGNPIFKISTQFKHSTASDEIYLPKLIDFIENDNSNPAKCKILYGFVNNTDTIYYSFNCNFEIPNV